MYARGGRLRALFRLCCFGSPHAVRPLSSPPQVSSNGLDPMMWRFMEEALLLSHDALQDINMNSSRFDMVWDVVYQQLVQGILQAVTNYSGRAGGHEGGAGGGESITKVIATQSTTSGHSTPAAAYARSHEQTHVHTHSGLPDTRTHACTHIHVRAEDKGI